MLDFAAIAEFLWSYKFVVAVLIYLLVMRMKGSGPFPEYENHRITSLSSVEEWRKYLDAHEQIAFRADIKSMPTFKLYQKGKEVRTLSGFQPGTMKSEMDKTAKEAPAGEKKSD
eukprot:g9358.t1